MWRRTYLLLILVRLYFAFSPSYLHPDENFQGPEVIAGEIFSYPIHLTWEFTSSNPVRSVFPLWPVYGLPMLLLRWVWAGSGNHNDIEPAVVFWTLRGLMFILSFVLEDWAIHELVQSPRQRRMAVLLVASSYVTWTYQTHTFSNSVETLLVAWSLVLIQRIVGEKQRSSGLSSGVLGFLVVFGIFNRITFPAFLLIPGVHLFPHFYRKPLSLLCVLLSASTTLFMAIYADTAFYSKSPVTLTLLLHHPVITPLNNLLYNLNPRNLALHGLHPFYQHAVFNLPLLLGPAFLLLITRPRFTPRLLSAISGIAVLSVSPHQEARFLLPAVPLILSSIEPPKRHFRVWIGLWLGFNALIGILMGVYHQGGIVPTQLFLAGRDNATTALWWKTYSPPIWLLDGANEHLTTKDLMGMKPEKMIGELQTAASCQFSDSAETYLVAPSSASWLDRYTSPEGNKTLIQFTKVWEYRQHLNLDDMDFGDDGVWDTLSRVIGRRGLSAWQVTRNC